MKTPRKTEGFTLVELLIVVAIIGVLSTVGIPTFRKMVQRAKMSEAKVELGAIYKTEAGFRGEYGAYGNNLFSAGYIPAAVNTTSNVYDTQAYYNVGFPEDNSCQTQSLVKPSAGPAAGEIARTFPAYYSGIHRSIYRVEDVAALEGYCLFYPFPADGASFIATASGVIAPGIVVTSTDPEDIDMWSINDSRQLSHEREGVK